VLVKYCVFFAVRAESLTITQANFGFKGLSKYDLHLRSFLVTTNDIKKERKRNTNKEQKIKTGGKNEGKERKEE
jgi:hypothetical protein